MSASAAVSENIVVDFSTAAASKSPSTEAEAIHPDARLIKACIDFAIALRGASGAFEADPTGDNDFASKTDVALLARAHRKLDLIVRLIPATLDGLRAKAAAADIAHECDLSGASYILSALSADIKSIHRTSKNTNLVITS